jgi:hypothetical protein
VVPVFSDVSEERIASIFRAGGGDTFLRNVGKNRNHTVLHPRRRYSARIYPSKLERKVSLVIGIFELTEFGGKES